MKVHELITELQKHNQELDIYLDTYTAEEGGTGAVGKVYEAGDDLIIQERRAFQ